VLVEDRHLDEALQQTSGKICSATGDTGVSPFDPKPLEQRTPQVCAVCECTEFTPLVQSRGESSSGTVWRFEVQCDLCETVWVACVLMRQFALDGEVQWTQRDLAEPGVAADDEA
jgi:hypothetical protein